MEKSHAGLGYHLCPVCTKKHDEVVLLDKRLRNTLDHENFVGWEMCKEHQKLYDEDYVAFVVIDEEKSPQPFKIETVVRTGQLAHLKITAYNEIFDTEIPDNPARIAFCPQELIDMLQNIQQKQGEQQDAN